MHWIFLAMARHPDLSELATADEENYQKSNEEVGALFTRLIADDCKDEMTALVAESGPGALASVFEVLGRVAMQELMAHPNVAKSMGALHSYIDQGQIRAVVGRQK